MAFSEPQYEATLELSDGWGTFPSHTHSLWVIKVAHSAFVSPSKNFDQIKAWNGTVSYIVWLSFDCPTVYACTRLPLSVDCPIVYACTRLPGMIELTTCNR